MVIGKEIIRNPVTTDIDTEEAAAGSEIKIGRIVIISIAVATEERRNPISVTVVAEAEVPTKTTPRKLMKGIH